MKKTLVLAFSVAIFLLIATVAGATTTRFEAWLSGLQEVGPNASPATGHGIFDYDDITQSLTYSVSYQDLTGSLTAAHIHNAAVGFNGAVIFTLSTDSNPMSGILALNSAQQTELFAGRYYVNVHTTTLPGGEIRDQLTQVPAPEPSSLLALAIPACALLLRRRTA